VTKAQFRAQVGEEVMLVAAGVEVECEQMIEGSLFLFSLTHTQPHSLTANESCQYPP